MLDETITFSDSNTPSRLNIIGINNHKVYCFIEKWDIPDNDYFYVSESTYELLKYEYPELIISNSGIIQDNVPHNYYHEVVIKMGLFSRTPQFKKLKLHFMKYNNEIFNDKINHKLVMMIGMYKNNTLFSDLEDCAGYSSKDEKLILLKYLYFNSIDSIGLSRGNVATILHEMCHAYVDVVYGTNWETDRNKYGDVLYNMKTSEALKQQIGCHGEKFGNTVKMVSDKTGLSFDEIFSYRVQIDSTSRKTKFINNIISNSNITYTSIRTIDNEDDKVKEIKTFIINNKDKLSDFIVSKTGLNIKFDVSDEQLYATIIDRTSNIIKYDISFSWKCQIDKIYINTKRPLYVFHVTKTSTPKSVCQTIIKAICKDAMQSI